MLLQQGPLLHLAASLLFGAVWMLVRRRQLSATALRVLDIAALVGGCALYALMGIHLVRMEEALGISESVGIYSGLLAAANVVAARAITVPSTATRTFWASSLAMSALLPATAVATGPTSLAATVINVTCWCAVSIAIATVGSRVIFGLRTEAARVRRLGQYTLEEKIGAGGMGVVYRASHAMLRRPTAIKLLPPDRAGEDNLKRFEREVQITAELSHPNTVAIYDYGRTPDGLFYYAMEFLDGVNLDQLVRHDGAIPAGRVVSILAQVCGALAEAHGRGLLHRDIKPGNIILTERGGEFDVAKVVDFGLVKRFETATPDVTMSASIVLAGTPLYMPPEVLTTPDSGDPRSDLYAVGAVAYFLLTGEPVFNAESAAEVFAHHLHTEPTPPSRRTTRPVPADLEAVVLRCLSKQLEDRPADARALRDELLRCRSVPPWKPDDAAAWWQRFRASGGAPTSEPVRADASQAVTVSVDLARRLPAS
jgi:serine/threonine-protein kinase